ncbi:MAG: glycosyltransferase [Desulfobacteraceae bacterium]|nr:glycosyltransferase [Desulfobacteraceae bacterium]MBC2754906.1 glycosyltransferase [Desulfobacteraceae bacterium]
MLQFAIVIPNLNQSRFLPDAFESLRHQSVPFDLAVMDGGSTDQFDQVIQKYNDIISCVRSGPDGGQARAIADGNEMITGDIISWLNADDYYFPGALDKVASVFEKHPEIDVIYGDAIHVKPDGAFISYFPAIGEFNPKLLPLSCFICQPACFVRRFAYNAAGGINPALKYTMDWDLWCRLAATGARFKYLHDVLAAVRYYPETKTLSGDKQRYHEIWRIGKRYGKRVLPISWLGFYRFDLSFKKDKSAGERLIFNALEWMRKVKKRVFKQTQNTLYGFYPWQSEIDGQCLIQLPWYSDRKSASFVLQVTPEDVHYQIKINSVLNKSYYAVNGRLQIPVPKISEPYLEIRIKCPEKNKWELTDFSFADANSPDDNLNY